MRQPRALTIFPLAAIAAAVAIASCQDESDTGPRVTGIQAAKPASQDRVEVTGTDPTGAPQDTTLDVEVFGSGFDNGSTVQLTLSGVPTEKVRTNSTRYRNSRTLIANITIAADAEVDFYDVEVTTASRKKGIGSEMFEVFMGGPKEVMVQFVGTASPELEGFFGGATLDFSSAPQLVPGNLSGNSMEGKFTPFTLRFEPPAGFYDGKDPNTDPICETGFLETILDAAAANGGSLDGSLKLDAQWDPSKLIDVRFMVAVDRWEYLIRTPGLSEAAGTRFIQRDSERTTLAIRHGHFSISKRRLGQKGTWWELERCMLSSSEPSNGIIEFEIWVSGR